MFKKYDFETRDEVNLEEKLSRLRGLTPPAEISEQIRQACLNELGKKSVRAFRLTKAHRLNWRNLYPLMEPLAGTVILVFYLTWIISKALQIYQF